MRVELKAKDLNKKVFEICKTSKIIVVLTIEDEEVAIPLAEALMAGGLPVLEITLRTPNALKVIKKMASIKNTIIGAGTVLNSRDVEEAKLAGAKFAVSPGITDELVDACENYSLPILGGVSSVSEAMKMLKTLAHSSTNGKRQTHTEGELLAIRVLKALAYTIGC